MYNYFTGKHGKVIRYSVHVSISSFDERHPVLGQGSSHNRNLHNYHNIGLLQLCKTQSETERFDRGVVTDVVEFAIERPRARIPAARSTSIRVISTLACMHNCSSFLESYRNNLLSFKNIYDSNIKYIQY